MIVIPGTTALSDIKALAEFIKLISTSEGLAQVLEQIKADKTEVERIASETLAEKNSIEAQKKEAHNQINYADQLLATAKNKDAIADEKLKQADADAQKFASLKHDVEQREEALAAKEANFEKDKADAVEFLNNKEKDISTRLEEADNLKDFYEKKIAEFKSIAGG